MLSSRSRTLADQAMLGRGDAEFFSDGNWRSLVVINVGRPDPDGFRDRLPRLSFADVSRTV